MTPKQQARVNIDAMLEQAGWSLQNADALNLYASSGVETQFTNGFDPESGLADH